MSKMLHNKHFELLQAYTGDYTTQLYGRALVGKASLSQKTIALTLAEMEKQAVLRAIPEGKIKLYQLNLQNTAVKDLLIIAELMKKTSFLAKQRKLAHLFRNDERIVGIFGSYAQGTQKEDSDIDVFIVGPKLKEDYDYKGSLLDLNISIQLFSETSFKMCLKKKDNLCKEIFKNHIILFGHEKFVNLVWRFYYGFD